MVPILVYPSICETEFRKCYDVVDKIIKDIYKKRIRDLDIEDTSIKNNSDIFDLETFNFGDVKQNYKNQHNNDEFSFLDLFNVEKADNAPNNSLNSLFNDFNLDNTS